MKINLALIVAIIVAVGLVAFGFTAYQISFDRQNLKQELESRTIHNADEFYLRYLNTISSKDSIPIKNADSLLSRFSLEAATVYFNADSVHPLNRKANSLVS